MSLLGLLLEKRFELISRTSETRLCTFHTKDNCNEIKKINTMLHPHNSTFAMVKVRLRTSSKSGKWRKTVQVVLTLKLKDYHWNVTLHPHSVPIKIERNDK